MDLKDIFTTIGIGLTVISSLSSLVFSIWKQLKPNKKNNEAIARVDETNKTQLIKIETLEKITNETLDTLKGITEAIKPQLVKPEENKDGGKK